MKTIVVGLCIQGNKRRKVAADDVVAAVEPTDNTACYKAVQDVPLDSFDSALVCTPDNVKYEILEYLLYNRKHVLVEKPLLTDDENSLQRLRKLAADNGVTCYTAYNHRFEPHIERVKSYLDEGSLGQIYSLRCFYGNGTARDVRNSAWRDTGMGVLSDIGSHLLDMLIYLLGDAIPNLVPLNCQCIENRAFDYISFGSAVGSIPRIQLEASLLSWRNTFDLDIIAESGSLHVSCLCKWGPSTFTVRERVLPSGRPTEHIERLECADPTWDLEYQHFKQLCQTGANNLENDIWINSTLNNIFQEAQACKAQSC